MKKFKCNYCGQMHDYFLGIKSLEPGILLEMSKEEQEKRIVREDFIYFIDNEFVLTKAHLFIKIQAKEQVYMYFETWVEVDINEFMTGYKQQIKQEFMEIEGKLHMDLLLYENSKNSKIKLTFFLVVKKISLRLLSSMKKPNWVRILQSEYL